MYRFYRLVYLDATLLEVQRKISLAPMGVPHSAINDTELAGYYIPKVRKYVIIINNLYFFSFQ